MRKSLKLFIAILILFCLLIHNNAFAANNTEIVDTQTAMAQNINTKPKYIKFNKTTLKMGIGEKYTLTYVLPENSKPKSVKFTTRKRLLL